MTQLCYDNESQGGFIIAIREYLVMDYRIIVSPEKGFWSDHGWQMHLSEATHISSTTELVLSFKDSDVKVIRRKDIQPMTRHAFLSFLLKVCLKRLSQGLEQSGLDGLIGASITSKDQKICIGNASLTLEHAERHAHSLVWGRKPSTDDLARWGRRFLQYHVAAGDHDTIYVISLSSPAAVQMLPHPCSKKA